MKKIALLGVTIFLLSLCSGCSPACEHDYELVATKDSGWRTYIVGSDFDTTGLEISLRCKKCHAKQVVDYELENDKNLTLDQKSVLITHEDYQLELPITVKNKYRIACIGDSLTEGHMWPNQSYPSYLSAAVSEKYEVGNFGRNGISVTGYGGSWDDPNMRYIKQDNYYKKSVDYNPDIFAIMLGTNDATGWEKAEATFEDEYHILLDSYVEQFPNARFIMMVSPPTQTPNNFNIPNDVIKEKVNPIQRELAEEYGFELIDFREEFEETDNYESKFLRPGDGVHFTVEGAQYVANRVWEVAKDLVF